MIYLAMMMKILVLLSSLLAIQFNEGRPPSRVFRPLVIEGSHDDDDDCKNQNDYYHCVMTMTKTHKLLRKLLFVTGVRVKRCPWPIRKFPAVKAVNNLLALPHVNNLDSKECK